MKKINDLTVDVYFGTKKAIYNFIHDEKGVSELLSMLIILGIVILVGFALRKQIIGLVNNLWDAVFEGGTETNKGDMKSDFFE